MGFKKCSVKHNKHLNPLVRINLKETYEKRMGWVNGKLTRIIKTLRIIRVEKIKIKEDV